MNTDLSEQYLDQHKVLVYLQDAILQLLIYKDENPKVNVKKYLSEYFNCVRDGNHVFYREFDFISSTMHNRRSFLKTFWKCFRYIGRRGDALRLEEYHSLLALICADFPFEVVYKTGLSLIRVFPDGLCCLDNLDLNISKEVVGRKRHQVVRILSSDTNGDVVASFSDFLYAFQLHFLFEEFLRRSEQIHESLSNGSSRSALVVVPSSDSGQPSQTVSSGEHSTPAAATSDKSTIVNQGECSLSAFLRQLQTLTEKVDLQSPPYEVIEKTFVNHPATISWKSFVSVMMRSDELANHIDILPIMEHLHIEDDFEILDPIDIAIEGRKSKRYRSPRHGKSRRPSNLSESGRTVGYSIPQQSSESAATNLESSKSKRGIVATTSVSSFKSSSSRRKHSVKSKSSKQTRKRAQENDSCESEDSEETDNTSSSEDSL